MHMAHMISCGSFSENQAAENREEEGAGGPAAVLPAALASVSME
jgi:hypothetical protein